MMTLNQAQKFPRRGLYAITRDPKMHRASLVEEVALAIRGGAAVIQYRAKRPEDPYQEAAALLALCQRAGIPLIINDDIALAQSLGADGVHLGSMDQSFAVARAQLGPHALIGISCYDDIDRAIAASEKGADYVAFGRFFPSRTKPLAPTASLLTLEQAQSIIEVPVVAIGGITLENAETVLQRGADLLAVVEGVFGHGDPEQNARSFRDLF
ncbi:MAG: thiamine phosphate synthase [Methylococcus sp.]